MPHDHNAAGNALYVDPPRDPLRRAVTEGVVIALSLLLPFWAIGRYRLLDGPEGPTAYWWLLGISGYYTAWGLGFAGYFLRRALLTATSGRLPHTGAFVMQRTRVRYGAPAWLHAGLCAAVGVALLYGIVHVWRMLDLWGRLAGG
jgi:hypothetical protein